MSNVLCHLVDCIIRVQVVAPQESRLSYSLVDVIMYPGR